MLNEKGQFEDSSDTTTNLNDGLSRQKKRRGSPHLTLIICLAVALIFSLGWIIWQNFIQKTVAVEKTTIVTVEKQSEAKSEQVELRPDGKLTEADLAGMSAAFKAHSGGVKSDCVFASKLSDLVVADPNKIPDGYVTRKPNSDGGVSVTKYESAAKYTSDFKWAYANAGCGSGASILILANTGGNSWEVISESASMTGSCQDLDFSGVPGSIARYCYDEQKDSDAKYVDESSLTRKISTL